MGGLHWLWISCLLGKLIYKNNQTMRAQCPLFLLFVAGREPKISNFEKGQEREAGLELHKYRTAWSWKDPIRISSWFIWNPAGFPVGAHPKDLPSSDLFQAGMGEMGKTIPLGPRELFHVP